MGLFMGPAVQANGASRLNGQGCDPVSDPVRTWPLTLKFSLVISKSMAYIDRVGFFSAISFLC